MFVKFLSIPALTFALSSVGVAYAFSNSTADSANGFFCCCGPVCDCAICDCDCDCDGTGCDDCDCCANCSCAD